MTRTPAFPLRALVRFGLPGAVLVLGLLLTLGTWRRDRSAQQREVHAYFDYRSRDAVARIEARLRHYEQALLATRGLFQAREAVSQSAFAPFVASLEVAKCYPGIQGIGFSLRVPPAELDRHLVQLRRQGFPDYHIRPAGKRAVYTSIIYLEPFKERNLRAFGFDMFSEPVRQEAMGRATDLGEPALSGKVQLVQETDEDLQAGVLLYLPVYLNGRAAQTVEDRRRHLLGWVYAPFRMNDFMRGVLGEGEHDLDLELFDGPVASAETKLFDRDPAHPIGSSTLPQARQTLSFGGHAWTVTTQATPTFMARHGQDTPTRALGLGILVSLLLGLMTFVLARHLAKIRSHNATLEQKIQERTQALGERERHFRIVADYTYDWELWEDPGGAILYCSPSCERITGYGPDAFTADLGLLERLLHPEDRPAWQAHRAQVHAVASTREAALTNGGELDFRLFRPDGEIRWIGHVCHPLHDAAGHFLGHRISNRDITERKQAENALRTSEESLATTLHSIGDAVVATNIAGLITRMNPSAERLTGWPMADALDRPLTEIFRTIHAQTRVPSLDPLQTVLAQGEVAGLAEHTLLLARDGQEYRIDESAAPIHDASGQIIGMVLVFSDVTELYRAEKDKAEIQAQLQQSQKLESLGTLAGGVAHDMNNVLGAILGLASAHLSTQTPGSPLHQALGTICKAAVRGGETVKSLLSFARQHPAESHRLDVNVILKEQVSLLARTTLAKVRLNLDLEGELRPIQGDASALTHAFMNLCVNAVDAMPENGTLTLQTRNVDNAWIEVVVEDNGTGMPKGVLEKAMDPFFTTKETGKGTGLGLSMVFSTVKAHRGQLAIESELDKGTRVVLRFPAFEQEVPIKVTAPAVADAMLAPQGSLKVLLVDDDDLIQSAIQAILEFLGHTAVTTAQSGEEALAKLEGGLEPDLVILDMNMPGLGGIGTLPRLRVLRPEVPVLLATGRTDQTALDLVSAHPGVTLLPKPFGVVELQNLLEKNRARAR